MGLFARAARKAFDQGIGTLQVGGHLFQIGGTATAAGVRVDTDKAMRYSAFWSAVRILSDSVAMLPLNVYIRQPDGSRTVDHDHPVQKVMKFVANPEISAFRLKQTGMAHVATQGNFVAAAAYDDLGRLQELWPLAPERMNIERKDGDLKYTYTRVNGTQEELGKAEVFHVPGLSWDGVRGYSVLRNARESVGLGLAAEEHGSRVFSNGAASSFVLATDNALSDAAMTHLGDQIREEKAGLRNAWKPWILEEGLKPVQISMPNDDAQWLETRKHQVTEIARWFRIPPHMLAELDRATFSNIEQQAREFVDNALMPWLTSWEAEIGMQLLGADWEGFGGQRYVKFNVSALVRGDIETRYKSYATGRQWGFLSANRIAELEDWDPIPGGDEYLFPLNMTTIGENGVTQTTFRPNGGTNSEG